MLTVVNKALITSPRLLRAGHRVHPIIGALPAENAPTQPTVVLKKINPFRQAFGCNNNTTMLVNSFNTL